MLSFESVSWRRSERIARLVLAQGSSLAREVARSLGDFRTCWLIDPSANRLDGDRVGPPDGISAEREAEACLGTFVGCLPRVRMVLVEDGDQVDRGQVVDRRVFIDSHPLRWADVGDGLLQASSLLRQDVHGIPICGYLSDRSSADWAFEPDAHFSTPQVASMAHSIRAVLVPMFDAYRTVAFCRD
jgi:hypothetical protein